MLTAPSDLAVDAAATVSPSPVPRRGSRGRTPSTATSAPRMWSKPMIDDAEPLVAEVTGRRLVAWPFQALRSGQHVRWRVRVASESATDAAWSAFAVFEAGLLDEDWIAQWISPVEAPVGSDDDSGYGRARGPRPRGRLHRRRRRS